MITKELIKNWHLKASQNDDYFSKFVFEYLAFIAYIRKYVSPSSSNDKEAIQLLKNNVAVKDNYFKSMKETECKTSWEIIINEFNNNARLGNASSLNAIEEIKRRNHVCTTDHPCDFRTVFGCDRNLIEDESIAFDEHMKGVIWGMHDRGNMIEFWVSIRNNLFHGSKDPEERRDQLVVEHGFKTLHLLVELLLTDNI